MFMLSKPVLTQTVETYIAADSAVREQLEKARRPLRRAVFLYGCAARWRVRVIFRKIQAANKLAHLWRGVSIRRRYQAMALARRQRIAAFVLTHHARTMLVRRRYQAWARERLRRLRRERLDGLLKHWLFGLIIQRRYWRWALPRRKRIAKQIAAVTLTRGARDALVRTRYRKWAGARRERIAAERLTWWGREVVLRMRYQAWAAERRRRLERELLLREAEERAARQAQLVMERERMQMWQPPVGNACVASGAAVMFLGGGSNDEPSIVLAREMLGCQPEMNYAVMEDGLPFNYFEIHVKTLGAGASVCALPVPRCPFVPRVLTEPTYLAPSLCETCAVCALCRSQGKWEGLSWSGG